LLLRFLGLVSFSRRKDSSLLHNDHISFIEHPSIASPVVNTGADLELYVSELGNFFGWECSTSQYFNPSYIGAELSGGWHFLLVEEHALL